MNNKHVIALAAAALLAACAQQQSRTDSGSPAPAPAARAPSGPAPGMNAQGEVVDSSKVSSGYGQRVKGINNWEGEITGKARPGAPFTKLQIGMSMRQAVDLVGQPTDSGAYVTGKAWIPFYFGSDRHRYEMVYKNQGRLIFAGGSLGNWSGGNLIWVIHNPNEPGYR